MTSSKPPTEPEIACSLSAAELDRRLRSVSSLVAEAMSVRRLDDGLALDLPASDETAARLLDQILEERRCCPFFRFELVFEPQQSPIRLRLRGPGEVRELVGQITRAAAAPNHPSRASGSERTAAPRRRP